MPEPWEAMTPAARLLGREVVRFDPVEGCIEVRYEARPEFANRHGTVQGGLLGAMLDSAASGALHARLPAEFTAVTRRLDTRFVAPARTGTLVAHARVLRCDERDAEIEAQLSDSSGRVVATARAEMRILARRAHA